MEIATVGTEGPPAAPERQTSAAPPASTSYRPQVPFSMEETGISRTLVEDLFLRHAHLKRCNTIELISQSMALPYPIVSGVFRDLRQQRLLEVSGMLGDDYVFALTGAGRAMAAERCRVCQYAGPAPVSLGAYQRSMREQRPQVAVNRAALRAAFGDLVVSDRLLDQLGPALVAQTPIFLYGPTGTGKSSLAERLLRVYGDELLIPYAVEVDNQIIALFDPAVHERIEVNLEDVDPRWMACRRPCVIVGGELVPSMLELRLDPSSGTYAPPVQMRANGGMLVIDDFGRQLIPPRDLLNRWIVPLDRRVDYLALSYGVRFDIPFELMIVFATNLDPAELADEAFLRRIPNKICVEAVDSEAFDEIFRRVLARMDMTCEDGMEEFFRELCVARSGDLRPSYPRDMCRIVNSLKKYEGQPLQMTRADLTRAVDLFFGAPGANAQNTES